MSISDTAQIYPCLVMNRTALSLWISKSLLLCTYPFQYNCTRQESCVHLLFESI